MTTFAAVSRLMEPTGPIGLRGLAHRHRWLHGDPPQPISLREVLERHQHPGVGHHRFLAHNTFLLSGFEVTLCNTALLAALSAKAGVEAPWLVHKLGVTPQEVADAMGISAKELVKGLGIPESAIRSAFSDVVDTLVSGLTFGLVDVDFDDILDELSPGQIFARWSITIDEIMDKIRDAIDILHAFCQRTLDLIESITGWPVSGGLFRLSGKPEREERAREIGTMLGRDYDLAALSEVTNDDDLGRVTARAKAEGRDVEWVQGPGPDGNLSNSGLVGIGLDRDIVASNRTRFTERGNPVRDADHWANKGVVRTVYDVGLGRLEVYHTHLFAGGALIGDGPDDDDRLALQLSQVGELMTFYRATHEPENVAIVCGDFNMYAHKPEVYGELVQALNVERLIDAWPFHRHRVPQASDHVAVPRGDTSAANDDDGPQLDRICVETPGGWFCDDAAKAPEETKRIDYVFVEQPRPEHTYRLDFTRLRRRPFPRNGTEAHWLSDHVGLDTILITSPR